MYRNLSSMARNNPINNLEQRFRTVLYTFPTLAGNEVVNFAKDNFRKRGFQGSSFIAWRPRKERSRWGKTPRNKGRALLIDTSRLRRSIRILYTNTTGVAVGSDVPYASAHNNGLRLGIIQNVRQHKRRKTKFGAIQGKTLKTRSKLTFGRVDTGSRTTVKAHRRRINQRIPERRYLGESPYLSRNINRVCTAALMKALR